MVIFMAFEPEMKSKISTLKLRGVSSDITHPMCVCQLLLKRAMFLELVPHHDLWARVQGTKKGK